MFDIEIDAYIHCVSAFVKLAQSEYQLLTEIVPEHHQKKTFDSLIQVSWASPLCISCKEYVQMLFPFFIMRIWILLSAAGAQEHQHC